MTKPKAPKEPRLRTLPADALRVAAGGAEAEVRIVPKYQVIHGPPAI